MIYRLFSFCLGASLIAGSVAAQETPPAASSPFASDEVVAVIEGKEYTVEDIEWIRKNTPPEFVKQTAHMTYGAFLEALAFQIALAKKAEQMELAEKEPYRTRLEINQRIFLTNAYLSEIQSDLNLTQEDYRQFYEENKDDFTELRISAIYLDYVLNPEKAAKGPDGKPYSEAEALEKANQLVSELREDADFAAMAREHSDDPTADEKSGDLGVFKRDSRMPETLKTQVFGLQEGEVSDPVKYGGRYYIFKVTERKVIPYSDALQGILQRIQDVKIKEKLDEIRAETEIEIKNPAFAASRPEQQETAPPPTQPLAPKE